MWNVKWCVYVANMSFSKAYFLDNIHGAKCADIVLSISLKLWFILWRVALRKLPCQQQRDKFQYAYRESGWTNEEWNTQELIFFFAINWISIKYVHIFDINRPLTILQTNLWIMLVIELHVLGTFDIRSLNETTLLNEWNLSDWPTEQNHYQQIVIQYIVWVYVFFFWGGGGSRVRLGVGGPYSMQRVRKFEFSDFFLEWKWRRWRNVPTRTEA